MNTSAGDGAGIGQNLARVGGILAQIVAPTTFVAAVLMYFGALRTNSMYFVLGVNSSMLGFSFQDYVLRSVQVAVEPLVLFLLALLLMLLAAPFAHQVLIRSIAGHRTAAVRTILVLTVLGVAGIVVTLAVLANWLHAPFFVMPLCLDLGVILLFCSAYLSTRVSSGPAVSLTGQIIQRSVLVALLLVSVLWVVADRAVRVGLQDADEIAANPSNLMAAVVYAPQRLHLEGPGITEKVFPDPNAKYRYRYTGLRLLLHSDRRYFFVPACWGTSPGARTIALPADDSLRLESFMDSEEPVCP
ncbi:hypothetical protein GCM10022419_131500 [Nonomuraea rosea]|uniref:DUF5671 domain-containing protein n=1 Tax=Nonomuraea rosea TaxID=638574 RepID=A0ABP7A2C7_9ACTN